MTLKRLAVAIVGFCLVSFSLFSGLTAHPAVITPAGSALNGPSTVLTITSNVITPTSSVHHVGAGLVKTITVPGVCTPICRIAIVPDAAFTYDNTGNIVQPAGGGTAVINKLMDLAWDGSKWTPSY